MRKFFDEIFKNQSLIYKCLLYIASVFFIVFFFPKGGQFKYEFQKGKPWQHENLYAPFDFSIEKSSDDVFKEQEKVRDEKQDYYGYDDTIVEEVINAFTQKFPVIFSSDDYNSVQLVTLETTGKEILDGLYKFGVIRNKAQGSTFRDIYLVRKQEATIIAYDKLYHINDVEDVIDTYLKERRLRSFSSNFQQLFSGLIKPNVIFNRDLTQKALESELSKISLRYFFRNKKSIMRTMATKTVYPPRI